MCGKINFRMDCKCRLMSCYSYFFIINSQLRDIWRESFSDPLIYKLFSLLLLMQMHFAFYQLFRYDFHTSPVVP